MHDSQEASQVNTANDTISQMTKMTNIPKKVVLPFLPEANLQIHENFSIIRKYCQSRIFAGLHATLFTTPAKPEIQTFSTSPGTCEIMSTALWAPVSEIYFRQSLGSGSNLRYFCATV
jgi:hypothetical protein